MPTKVICPECAQGKHHNCTHDVPIDLIAPDGEWAGEDWVVCACEEAGHD